MLRAAAVLSSIGVAVALLGLLEMVFLPQQPFARSWSVAFAAFTSLQRDAWTFLGGGALALAPLGLVAALHGSARWQRFLAAFVLATTCTALARLGYDRLLLDPVFNDYLPARLVWVGLGASGFFAFAITLVAPEGKRLWKWLRYLSIGASALAVTGFEIVNQAYYPRLYPSFHLSLSFAILAMLVHTLSGLLLELVRRAADGLRRVMFGFVTIALGSGLVATVCSTAQSEAIRGLVRRNSVLGRAAVLFFDESSTKGPVVLRDPDAVERFRQASGLPELPSAFELARYNVLFVSCEATRYDQTSLADPRLKTTPQLVAFRDRGAYSFSRAYSPSSSTFQVMSSIMTMQLPSMVDMKLANRSWFGTLNHTDPMVPELFHRAGYTTLRVTHNHTHSFDRNMIGLGRGFAINRLIPSPELELNTDELIVKEALRQIGAVPSSKRFFGWVFLVSPHGPYLVRDKNKPTAPLDRYRQELTYADARFGDLIAGLEKMGRLSDTVIVFVGDHGEEFRDHGGTLHKQTVYSESIHVPLLIWIPGMKGANVDKPTSSLYVFPWLLLRAPLPMRLAATRSLQERLGPALRDTDNAVIAELLGHDRMESALIYERFKLNYDFLTDATELFDLRQDPGEQNNRLGLDAAETRTYLAKLKAYRAVRDTLAKFDYERPTNFQLAPAAVPSETKTKPPVNGK
jgi:arylsulfatase A-like enzyme